MTVKAMPDSQGAKALRELDRVFRSLTADQRRAVIEALREVAGQISSPELLPKAV